MKDYQQAFYKSAFITVAVLFIATWLYAYQCNKYDELSRDHDKQNVAISELTAKIETKDEEIKTKDTEVKQLQEDLEKSK